MSETRTCEECGKHLITQRRGARFCGDECKNAWHNKHRRGQSPTAKRLTPVSGGVGTRGGNVRSVDEARDLQTASKALDRWRLAMELQIHRTLLETGHFHIDDLDCLNLPAEAFRVRGTLVSSVRRSGVMRSTNVYRKVSHKAANGRPAPIYEITPKGREQLPGLLTDLRDELPASSLAKGSVGLTAAARQPDLGSVGDGRSSESGEAQTGAGSPADTKSSAAPPPTAAAGPGSPEPLRLEGSRPASSMYDPFEDAA